MDGKTTQIIEKAKKNLSDIGQVSFRSQFGGYSLSINHLMFAIACDGELYLRADDSNSRQFQHHLEDKFIFTKRGRPVELNYYRVTPQLWQDQIQLIQLAKVALNGAAQRQKQQEKMALRLKDLPNLDYPLEQMLWKVGICDIESLHRYGAKQCYLKLRELKTSLGCHILFALQGAITGFHQAVLPKQVKNELTIWYRQYVLKIK